MRAPRRPRLRTGHTVALTLFYKNWPAVGFVPRGGRRLRVGAALHSRLMSK